MIFVFVVTHNCFVFIFVSVVNFVCVYYIVYIYLFMFYFIVNFVHTYFISVMQITYPKWQINS